MEILKIQLVTCQDFLQGSVIDRRGVCELVLYMPGENCDPTESHLQKTYHSKIHQSANWKIETFRTSVIDPYLLLLLFL